MGAETIRGGAEVLAVCNDLPIMFDVSLKSRPPRIEFDVCAATHGRSLRRELRHG